MQPADPADTLMVASACVERDREVGETVPTESDSRQLVFRDYLRILLRRRWIVVATTIVATAAAFLISSHQQHVYRASVGVLLSRQDLSAAATDRQVDPSLSEDPARYASTQALLARSGGVAQAAVGRVPGTHRSAPTLLAESSVTPNGSADILTFQVDDPDAAVAAQLARAYAAAFVSYKQSLNTTALKNARAQLTAQIASLRAKGLQDSPRYRDLAASEQQLHTMELLQRKDTVLGAPNAGTQVQPNPKRTTLLGFGFGLLLGIAAAFAIDAIDPRIKSEEEIEESLDLPLLARIPAPPKHLRNRFGLILVEEPRSAYADAVARLATAVSFTMPDHPARVLMFTSAGEQEGKSTTVSNLAVALARSGSSVAVVDLDLRQPTVSSLFNIFSLTGLTDVVVRKATLEQALVRVDLDHVGSRAVQQGVQTPQQAAALFVLPSGPLPASPAEFVGSEAVVARVLEPLRSKVDYVLIDTPPMRAVVDASIVAGRADGIVIVSRVGIAARPDLRELKRDLDGIATPTVGVVITGVDATAYGYGGYGRPYEGRASQDHTPGRASAVAAAPDRAVVVSRPRDERRSSAG
jgi:capsular exopolysaccharide synthesis family protein